jgi:proteasome lid subunit RPN8/RPN11
MNREIRIRSTILAQISEHARRESSRECCGLLAGRDGVITHGFTAENVASDPAKSYEIAPKQIVRMMREFRMQGLEFLGIYHSHPSSENKPSARDIEQAYYSEAVYCILSPRTDAPKPARAFSIREGAVTELEIEAVL